MSTNPTTDFPCARGCTWDAIGDEPARPRAAVKGVLCASCYYRIKHALDLIPDLMANMRSMIDGVSAAPLAERVAGGGDGSPAPLRIGPLDASDSLYAKLVSWTSQFAEMFGTTPPVLPSWTNAREVQGSRPVSPEAAHFLAAWLRDWFLDRLDQIAASRLAVEFHDDLCYGWDDARGVFHLTGAYGVEPRPLRAADKRECPVCGHREVFVKWPDLFDPEVAVLCGRCKWVAEPEKYGHYAKLFAS